MVEKGLCEADVKKRRIKSLMRFKRLF